MLTTFWYWGVCENSAFRPVWWFYWFFYPTRPLQERKKRLQISRTNWQTETMFMLWMNIYILRTLSNLSRFCISTAAYRVCWSRLKISFRSRYKILIWWLNFFSELCFALSEACFDSRRMKTVSNFRCGGFIKSFIKKGFMKKGSWRKVSWRGVYEEGVHEKEVYEQGFYEKGFYEKGFYEEFY